MNYTNDTGLEHLLHNVIISPISVLVSLIGIVGNCLVMWFLSFKIKKNPSTIYIFNLALADAFFLVCIAVFHSFSIVLNIKTPWEHQFENVHLNNVLNALMLSCLFGYNTSVSLLTAISVERCICVLFPIWYYCNRPRYLSSIICSAIWLMSCLFTILEFIYCCPDSHKLNIVHEQPGGECKYMFVTICFISFMLCIPSMTVSSLVLIIKVWTTSQHRPPQKLYLVITVTVIFFLLFAMPMRILLLVWYKRHIMPPFPIMDIFSLFTAVNSSINPFIYFLIGRSGSGGEKCNLHVILQSVFREEGSQIRKVQRNIINTKRDTIM
ncbi:proto-oncogene Mas-like [Pelobates fuscus]|uniref:proto-oncogene Mas-like n=1 Tax=Pelobates fuscus TaxID=191477 RepID=UPI002FE43762